MLKLNKILLSLFFTILLAPTLILGASAKISALEGTVKYLEAGAAETTWKIAALGQLLQQGSKISSSVDSWAELTFSNGHVAKLGADSSMLIGTIGKATSLEMFKGNLMSKVKKLSKKQTYEVLTPQSVCAVRGTVFGVMVMVEGNGFMSAGGTTTGLGSGQSGTAGPTGPPQTGPLFTGSQGLNNANPAGGITQVVVMEGSVSTIEHLTGIEVLVPAGQFTEVTPNQAPTPPAPAPPELLQPLTPGGEQGGDSGDQGSNDEASEEEAADEDEDELATKKNMKQMMRQELRSAVNDIKIDVASARDVVETTKESDASTGRTMRDVHGNLVRIEQYVLRPSDEVVQFINITKRNEYIYAGRMNVASSLASRLDSFESKITFNMAMPEKISDWLGFFKDVDDNDALDFHPLKMEIKTSNQMDTIYITSHWNEAEDDMDDPLMVFESATEGKWNLVIDDYEDFAADYRGTIYNEAAEGSGIAYGSEDEGTGWAISPKMLLYKDLNGNGKWDNDGVETLAANTKWVRSGVEAWVIDNDGKIFDFDSLESGDENPFALMKNIAFEVSSVYRYGSAITGSDYILSGDLTDEQEDSILYQNEALAGFNRADNFFSNNIDLVVTPDFLIPIVEEVAKGSANSL